MKAPPRYCDVCTYKGFHGCDSKCRVEIWTDARELKAAVVLTELVDNPGTSVTNYVEELATLVLPLVETLCECPPQSIIWIEHYEKVPQRTAERWHHYLLDESWGVVSLRWTGTRYESPTWKPSDLQEIERLVVEFA